MKEIYPKTLLIGGGIGQLHLANKLHEKGIDFIIVAYHVLEELRNLATKVIEHDLFDLNGVLEIARDEKIGAVLSDQHDLYIPTVAYVAEHMNLPGNSYEQAITYCNKNRFRSICDRLEVPVPKHYEITGKSMPLMNCGLSLPIMVKPADSQSSVGVVKIDFEENVKDAVANAISLSRSGSAIIEEFFMGQEVVCEGLIQNGQYYNLDFADREYFDIPDKFIPCRTIFPSTIPDEIKQRIVDCENRIAQYVKPSFAIVHSEYLWNKESNEIRCVESALRGGGVFISSHLIPACTGIDINDLLIDFSLGRHVSVKEVIKRKSNRAAAYICFYLPEGVIDGVFGIDQIRNRPGVIMTCLNDIIIGSKSVKMVHKGNRMGPILVHANTRLELENVILSIQKDLKVLVKTSRGVKTQIWE